MSMTITGPQAQLRWGYYQAAQLGSWSVEAGPGGGTLTATVVSQDAFRVSQRPLTFVVTRPKGVVWRWPIQTLQIAGTTLTASIGPQE